MSFCRRLIQFSLFSFFVSAGFPQTGQYLPRGEILDRVPCKLDPSQTYALYVPSNYAADRPWPILYALDAGARGNLPVEHFKSAAEKYGYILAGSNNSRNGPVKVVQDAMNALLVDTQSRFSADRRRIYVAGFSGGARAAVQIGLAMKGKIAGILAFGAGFPPDMPPTAALPFAMYFAAGDEDFNFPELRALDGTLKALQVPHNFETFSGGHEWPPEVVCTHAIEWLELQAMKSGAHAKDPLLIDRIYSKTLEEAESLESAHHLNESLEHYSALLGFSGLRDVTDVETKVNQLSLSAEVRKSRAEEKEVETRQKATDRELIGLFRNLIAGTNGQFVAQKLNAELDRIRNDTGQRKDEVRRLAANRSLTSFWVMLNQEASSAIERREYGPAGQRLELMARIHPENPQIYFHLALVYSMHGRKKDAIEALKNAVAKGFRDVAFLENDQNFESLRNMTEYRKVVENLRMLLAKEQ